jgi:Flp pilus assembly protein TadD
MTEEKVVPAMIEQGFAQLREGQFEEAIETFSACLVIESRNDSALRGRGLAHLQLNHPTESEADFRLAHEVNSSEPENWMGLGVSLAMRNKIYEAIRVYEDWRACISGLEPSPKRATISNKR